MKFVANRFEGFEELKRVDPAIAKSLGRSKDPRYKKVTIYLNNDLHRELRQETLLAEENMSELIERVMLDYFTNKKTLK